MVSYTYRHQSVTLSLTRCILGTGGVTCGWGPQAQLLVSCFLSFSEDKHASFAALFAHEGDNLLFLKQFFFPLKARLLSVIKQLMWSFFIKSVCISKGPNHGRGRCLGHPDCMCFALGSAPRFYWARPRRLTTGTLWHFRVALLAWCVQQLRGTRAQSLGGTCKCFLDKEDRYQVYQYKCEFDCWVGLPQYTYICMQWVNMAVFACTYG